MDSAKSGVVRVIGEAAYSKTLKAILSSILHSQDLKNALAYSYLSHVTVKFPWQGPGHSAVQ